MSEPTLETIRDCLEGSVPAALATCDAAGEPNVSLISQVHFVDPERVALSYQFFNKTRRNILATRTAAVQVVHPVTIARYRLELDYEETQVAGPLFEAMKAKLAGIASHTGMHGVFHLLGADVFRVRSIALASPPVRVAPAPPRNLLSAVRRTFAEIEAAADLGELFDRSLDGLRRHFGVEHAMALMLDEAGTRLYTVASAGYERSGIGSEIAVGDGVIGVAAREGVPIRIAHMSVDYAYGAAVREQSGGGGAGGENEIPYPGLAAPESQIAIPFRHGGRALGVLFAESAQPMRFLYDDEDALALVADRLGALVGAAQSEEAAAPEAPAPAAAADASRPIVVRHYPADDSVFLDHDYLIKGVAGAIFWRLVREHLRTGRVEFTNRELRLDPALRLPEHAENLEARLLLLQRRLRERDCGIRIDRSGRGRFRLDVPATLALDEAGEGAADQVFTRENYLTR
ncbi:GAF domain-containing protein [Amaricoccus sp.]|uniref:GAF domain-containing protein n=1 Tax=Amaricoccus sp. TaxID=1872485 RepID=UPI001B7AE7D9|nr:GAF domain-containing protein [Amaricoccus sp.]MBP7001220.1 GAF domain-containing protein [Amaricoccus sp.]